LGQPIGMAKKKKARVLETKGVWLASMKKNTSRTKHNCRKAIRALFRFGRKKLPAQRGEERSGIHRQLRLGE